MSFAKLKSTVGLAAVLLSAVPLAAHAEAFYGVNPNGGATSGNYSLDYWLELYGAFDSAGANVTATVQCVSTYSNGNPPVSFTLSYQESNWRSDSQVNLHFVGGCPVSGGGGTGWPTPNCGSHHSCTVKVYSDTGYLGQSSWSR